MAIQMNCQAAAKKNKEKKEKDDEKNQDKAELEVLHRTELRMETATYTQFLK